MILSPILTLDPGKVERDLAFMMDCLFEVLEESREHALARRLPWRETVAPAASDPVSPEGLSHACSIAFHLLSMVEQNAAIQQQRSTEAAYGLSTMQALWGQCLHQVTARGLEQDQIAAALRGIQVELVLTAHPTEAKRTIVLEHHRSLYLLLVKRENQVWTPYEQRAIREEVKTLLSVLWRTRRSSCTSRMSQPLHGRGGTMSRGGGPEHRFVKAIHASALNGDLRVTEQGEAIEHKYANRLTAVYNLELLFAGVTRATLLERHRPEPPHVLEPTMDWLAGHSRQIYVRLRQADGFPTFFRQATPIDVIEESRIGSRPSRRSGQPALDDLRAIPWVFSWSQARFFLPGWYGVGAALEALQIERPDEFAQLSLHLYTWAPLHYALSNAATCIAAADLDVMHEYAALVEDERCREEILALITDEFERTRLMLERIYRGTLAERRPNIHGTVRMRKEPLCVLHGQQIALRRQWRADRARGDEKAVTALLSSLLLTVNAIATGLGATG